MPRKICVVCKQPFSWRKKWRLNWESKILLKMLKKKLNIFLFLILFIFFNQGNLLAQNHYLPSLKDGGKIIFIRHALAPGFGDPENFDIKMGKSKKFE